MSLPSFTPYSGSSTGTVTITCGPVTYTGQPGAANWTAWALCPDLLAYEQIGQAGNLRGRVVRGFFWAMRWWKP